MKRTLRILRVITTVIGSLVLVYLLVGSFVWGIDFEPIEYDRDPSVSSSNLHNEGPFIFRTDSTFIIKHIVGNSDDGFTLSELEVDDSTSFKTSCYYHLDSSTFELIIDPTLENEPIFYDAPEKILAFSDAESNYGVFRDFLMTNEVIDSDLNWIFGSNHLVLIGDFIDRGYFSTQVLWFIYMLNQDAKKAGGKVHYILGNHEIMNIQGDHRYSKTKYRTAGRVLGLKEYQLYDTTTFLGEWLATKNIAEQLGDYLFVHGGLSPELVDNEVSLEEMNAIARANYFTPYFPQPNVPSKVKMVLDYEVCPYWYRGYFEEDLAQSEIDRLLSYYNCSQIIVGHTIQDEVQRLYDGAIVAIDVERPLDHYSYWPRIKAEGLLIEQGKFYRIDSDGKRTEI